MITTFTDHQDCARCQAALDNAKAMAAATGSIGCRSETDDTAIDGTIHRAAWFRDGSDPRPKASAEEVNA